MTSADTLPQSDLSTQVTPMPELIDLTGDRLKQAVTQAAATMQTPMYEAERLQKAMDLVLSGAVSLDGTGGHIVTSGSHSYAIDPQDGCPCKDAQTRSRWCKHAIATELFTRTMLRLGNSNGHGHHTNGNGRAHVATVPPSLTHQESVASANTHVMLAGHQVQITIRAGCTPQDVDAVISNMERILQRFPSVDVVTTSTNAEGWCKIHKTQMTKQTKNGQSWHSHQLPDGNWCKGK